MIDYESLVLFWRYITGDALTFTAALWIGFCLVMVIITVLVKAFVDNRSTQGHKGD